MKCLRVVYGCGLVIGLMLMNTFVHAVDIDPMNLIRDTQRVSQKPGEITLVWWLPEEFWKVHLAQTPGVNPTLIEGLLKTVRPYTVVAVVDGTVGPFGGVTFRAEDWIRANIRLVDGEGTVYPPKIEEEIDPDTKNLLQMLKPLLANLMGPIGKNFHFLIFPGKTSAGTPIARATEKGQFKIKLEGREFSWRLPLDALLPVKICPGCGEECKGSWSFCPRCGKRLME